MDAAVQKRGAELTHRIGATSTVRSTLLKVILVVASISLFRCSSPTSPGTVLPIARLRADNAALVFWSGYDQPATLVIRNAQDLASAWAIIYRGESSVPALPSVDFATQMIVGVAIGTRPDADTDVVITGASVANGTITVDATVTTQGPSCVTMPVLTSPVDLALLPATPGSVRLNLTRKTKAC